MISIFLFKEWKNSYILLLLDSDERLYYETGFLLNTHGKISQLVQKESNVFSGCHFSKN